MTATSNIPRRAVLIALAVAAVAAAALVMTNTLPARAQSAQAMTYVDQPDHWVPFSADMVIEHDGQTIVGKYFRSSDGSYRRESGPTPGDVRVIDIHNVQDGAQYIFSSKTGWRLMREDPLLLASPPKWIANRPNWTRYPFRLALRAGQNGHLNANDGFEAFSVTNQDGTVRLKIPELNLFDAVINRADGRHEQYQNIVIGEPATELFRPPANATVVEVPRPTRNLTPSAP